MRTPSVVCSQPETNRDNDIRVDLFLENVGPLLQLTWAQGSHSSLAECSLDCTAG